MAETLVKTRDSLPRLILYSCPKCGGAFYLDYDLCSLPEYHCLQCGFVKYSGIKNTSGEKDDDKNNNQDGNSGYHKMMIPCRYCSAIFPNFKALFDHYKEHHKDHLKWYNVCHKKRGGQGSVEATSEEEACKFFGWQIGECEIKQADKSEEEE